MASTPGSESQDVRYEPDEQPPLPLTIGLSLQYALLTVASVVLSPAILITTVGGSEAYLGWVVLPNTTYVHSIAVADLTRVTARAVGICVGIIFVILAFLPKLVAAVIAIPGPVAGAYFIVLVSSLFVLGLRVLLHDGLDYRKGIAVGLAFWLGLAFELDWIFPEYFHGVWGDLLANGLTVGGLTVIVLSQFVTEIRGKVNASRFR